MKRAFSKVSQIHASGPLQERALDRWLERNKDPVSKEAGWIETLPGERLKNHAARTMKKMAASAK